jgi:hypothetical protein
MSSVKNVAERQERQAQANQGNARVVESSTALNGFGVLGLTEVGKSRSSDVSCCSGLASGGVARSESEVFVVVDTSEFTGMDVSGVVSPGCGCRPGNNSSATGFDGERVFGFDAVDSIPANCGCNEGVHHGDALVEDQNFGSNKAKPSECCGNANEAELQQPAAVTEKDNLNTEKQVEQKNHTSHDKCRCGSKSMDVGHMTILPLTVKSSSLEGK